MSNIVVTPGRPSGIAITTDSPDEILIEVPRGLPGPPGPVGPPGTVNVVSLTQAEFDALPLKDPSTLYIING